MDKGRGWWEKEQINYRDRAADEEKGLLTFTPSFHSIVSLLHSSPPCPDLPFPSFIPFMFSLSFPFLFVSTPEPPPHDRSTPFPPSITSFFFLVPCDHKTYRNISEFQTFQPPSSSNSIHIFSFPSPLHCVPSWFANFLIFCTAPPFLNNPFFQSSLILSLFFHSFPLFLIPLTSLLLLFLLLFLLFSTISYLSLNLLHHLLVLLWSFFFFHSSLSLQPVMSFLLLMILPLFHHPSSLVSSSYTLSFINNLLSRAPVYFPHPQKKKSPLAHKHLLYLRYLHLQPNFLQVWLRPLLSSLVLLAQRRAAEEIEPYQPVPERPSSPGASRDLQLLRKEGREFKGVTTERSQVVWMEFCNLKVYSRMILAQIKVHRNNQWF